MKNLFHRRNSLKMSHITMSSKSADTCRHMTRYENKREKPHYRAKAAPFTKFSKTF